MRNAACHFRPHCFYSLWVCLMLCVAVGMGLTPCQNAHNHIAQGVNQNVVAIHMYPALVFTRGFQAWVLAVIDHFVAIAAVRAV